MSRREPWLLVLASRSVARAIGARLYGQVPRPGVGACSQWPLGSERQSTDFGLAITLGSEAAHRPILEDFVATSPRIEFQAGLNQ